MIQAWIEVLKFIGLCQRLYEKCKRDNPGWDDMDQIVNNVAALVYHI